MFLERSLIELVVLIHEPAFPCFSDIISAWPDIYASIRTIVECVWVSPATLPCTCTNITVELVWPLAECSTDPTSIAIGHVNLVAITGTITVFPLTHNRCEVVISWWSPLLPKISIYATKCESILEKSGIFIHLQSKYYINLSSKKNLTISWVQIAARW